MSVAPSWTTAWRRRRYSEPSSSLGSPPINTMVPPLAHASAIVVRGNAQTMSAGRPSPSWASTLSVPSTDLASLVQAYWASFVSRAPPMMPTAAGPASCSASVTRESASDQLEPTSSLPSASALPRPSPRTKGAVTRASLMVASKLKRSRSASQPQFTASESTPR